MLRDPGQSREAKHLWLFPLGGSLQKRSEMESLASRTSSAALQLRSIRMTAMRQQDRNLTIKGRINEASAATTKIPPLLDS